MTGSRTASGLALEYEAGLARRTPATKARSALAWQWLALALITAGAATLRLIHVGNVLPDPFYDAAVRSMALSWHNFFFGAFEPGGSVSIDKPPVDLWLQVASVKLFGFSATTLKLPEALAGTAAVVLLFAAVKRMWSTSAGLLAALALALLPVEVITSRSDTMDGVMMLLIVLALLLIVRACETGRSGWLLAAAAALGLAFNVKLLESLVALPGLVLFAYLGLPGRRRRRLLQLVAAAALYVAVALSWLTATLVVPAHERPFAIGSTNGSAWNAAFVFNGTDRLAGKSPEPQGTVFASGHRYPVATQSERDHIPIVPPSATRLLARIGPLSGERLGLMLLIGLILGLPALACGVITDKRSAEDERNSGADLASKPQRPPPRLRRAAAAGLPLWTLTGIVLFSEMARLHPRYVEGFTPAVASMLGIGLAWAGSGLTRTRLVALCAALAVCVYYVERLLYGAGGVWWIVLVAALGAIAIAALARLGAPGRGRVTATLLSTATIALAAVAVLALPLSADITAINTNVSDAGLVGALPPEELRLASAFLRAHQGSARYQVAAQSSVSIGALIVKDARPIVVLTTYNARVFTSISALQRLIAKGEVRYAFLNSLCGRHPSSLDAACSTPSRWVQAHGTDVSRQAGLRRGVLWLLPGAVAA
jgi:4-amino-4-deoxy-L-arabinose transferase-like glycosyltransferase